MSRHKNVLASAAIAAVLASSAAGCTSSGHSQEAAAAASSLAANPAVKKAEATLKANFAKDFTAAHPSSLKTVLKETFPGANSTEIVTYGLKTFTLKARHRGPAQDAWFQGVVLFALNKNAAGIPSGAASPSIPGVTASVPTPSATRSS